MQTQSRKLLVGPGSLGASPAPGALRLLGEPRPVGWGEGSADDLELLFPGSSPAFSIPETKFSQGFQEKEGAHPKLQTSETDCSLRKQLAQTAKNSDRGKALFIFINLKSIFSLKTKQTATKHPLSSVHLPVLLQNWLRKGSLEGATSVPSTLKSGYNLEFSKSKGCKNLWSTVLASPPPPPRLPFTQILR